MVVFKEDYDLTCRTPTPPAQRFHRMQAQRRQQQRERHLATVRGKFDAKRRETSAAAGTAVSSFAQEPAPRDTSNTGPAAVTLWGGIQTGRSVDELNARDEAAGLTALSGGGSRRMSGIFSSNNTKSGSGRGAGGSGAVSPGVLSQQNDPAFGQMLRDSPAIEPVLPGAKSTRPQQHPNSGGSGGMMEFSFNPLQPMQGIALPPQVHVVNDSFSNFFGGVSMRAPPPQQQQQQQRRGSANNHHGHRHSMLAAHAAHAVGFAMSGGHGHGLSHSNSHGMDDIFDEESPQLPQARDDDDDNSSYFRSPHRQQEQLSTEGRALAPPCGFDCLDDPTSLFVGEKRLSGEDHFERYSFELGADDIRDAAVVREFKKLVVDGHRHHSSIAMAQQQQQGGAPRLATSAQGQRRGGVRNPFSLGAGAAAGPAGESRDKDRTAVNSLASCRASGDPKDDTGVVEGLLGTGQRMAAPSAVEREAIRMLRVASGAQRGAGNRQTTGGDVLSARLARSVQRGRSQSPPETPSGGGAQQQHHHHHGGASTARTASSSYGATTTTATRPAAESVPRPPPGYYKSVPGRAQDAARALAQQAQGLAVRLDLQHAEDPNPLHHRPPFRLRGVTAASGATDAALSPRAVYRKAAGGGSLLDEEEDRLRHMSAVERQQARRIAQERQLEEDVQADIRNFEWRRSAQQHARQIARVQVARERELELFERRQCERFRDALARYEPGALQRTERAIQHRIAHELILKYGPAAFLSGESAAATDRDLVIPQAFQACAREAALVAAETARAEREQQNAKRKQAIVQSLQPVPHPALALLPNQTKPQQQQQQQPRPPSASTAAAARRPSTAAVVVRKGKPSIENYVNKQEISSSGYGALARARSLLPGGRAACQTEENDAFVGGARTVRDEIEAMEARCPGLSGPHVSPPLKRG